jgi:hypothetical protein
MGSAYFSHFAWKTGNPLFRYEKRAIGLAIAFGFSGERRSGNFRGCSILNVCAGSGTPIMMSSPDDDSLYLRQNFSFALRLIVSH